MILEVIQFLPLKDFLLVAVLFAFYVIGTGSLLHFVISERQYYEWSKNQPAKKPRKTRRAPSKTVKAARPMRRAKA